ncbi:lanthionine synthetase LanC family protein [Corynebacterium freiburgense]|uniref:lanthionine synthetase LanC family protein n=2 Tax=Corynebacterium freiburgense TaxID=556548 RepID=UPI000402A983|nr:lanthionine synthetase LanC family protein [Corynebacterium freiburgense]WJZ03835.1 Lanthionine synthetase C-like protein [Corynebacterium freiburgense]
MISMICDSDISKLVKQKYLVGNVSFAHGASGVIATLAQYERFHPGTPYMEEAILKLLQYEEEIGKGCLLDVRFEQDVDSLQWCNGSGGALIARAIVAQTTLRSAEAVALKDLRRQIPNLIRNENTLGNDCICHGISGSILIFEFLSDHLRSHKHELAYTAQHFKQSLAARFSVEDMKTATGISKHSKGLLVGSAGILCALGTQGYNGTIIPEW